MPLLGDAVTASGVGLERHGEHPGSWEGPLPYATRLLSASRTDPCTTVPRLSSYPSHDLVYPLPGLLQVAGQDLCEAVAVAGLEG